MEQKKKKKHVLERVWNIVEANREEEKARYDAEHKQTIRQIDRGRESERMCVCV